ncbi:MAG TPA: sulfatase-like hydrolase/transferase [Anaerolineales bacterium]|nr:sulfatase-like hydrolase/transferase [Anaerolineales bacterium]
MRNARIPRKTYNPPNGRALFSLTVLSACLYAAIEWLFFMTRPSPLSILALIDSVKILFVTAGTFTVISIALLAILSLPIVVVRNSNRRSQLLMFGATVPALLFSITALILFDNFMNAEFEVGILSSKGFLRGIYALGFLFFFWLMLLATKRAGWARRKFAFYLALILLSVSMTAILATRLARYPNIIILGSDGLSARYLTVYDSNRKTTPFLADLARQSLVAENAFPNAGSTTGSTTTVLTGKETIETNVYRYSDILSERDSLEHLPGILRQHGYKTIEIGTRDYVDARKINLLEGFGVVNNQTMIEPASNAFSAFFSNSLSTPFIQTIVERSRERLLHIFFIRDRQLPPARVETPAAFTSDEQRVEQIIDLLTHADRPLFVFAHLMDTHGPHFSFQKEVFSSEVSADKEWDERRYQDALLSFDGYVKRIYEHLAKTGQLDHTILVVYTDHGFRYAIHERIPILIHFPENANSGTRKDNVQNIDIPVTLLDYLGISRPKWMTGASLLNGEPDADRKIMSTTSGSPNRIAPPFYQIQSIQVIICQKWYVLNIREDTWHTGTINGHTAKCAEDILPSEEKVHQTIVEYLEKHNYDTSSLK